MEILCRMLVCALWFNAACPAFAASSSVDVRQTVIYTGGGFSLPVDATPPEISDVEIYDVGRHSAKIFWRTDDACLAELRYGLTPKVESGPLYDHPESYERSHEFSLENLKPGSRYYLKITVRSSKGIERSTIMYGFYTVPEVLAVPNVASLAAIQKEKKVALSWRNPSGGNFSGVQINRRIGSFAFRPDEGEKIFSGQAETFIDAGAADNTEYYYTVFSYDASGNFSSGAAVSIKTGFSAAGNGGEGGGNEGIPVPGGKETGGGEVPGNAGGNETGGGAEIGNVVDLSAAANSEEKKIVLSWKCPNSEKECMVEIRRTSGSPAGSPSEGEMVYGGSGTSFEDANMKEGQAYFYTVFTKDGSGNYSSGATAVSRLPVPGENEIRPDVFFTDAARGILLASDNDGNISIMEGDALGINCAAQSPSADIKTVVVLMDNAAYLTNFSADSQSHWTSITVPEAGRHNLMVNFIGNDDKMISYRHFFLNVVPKGKIFTLKGEGIMESISSWDKFVCRIGNILGGNNGRCVKTEGVEGAKITVFAKNGDGNREVWNAEEFNQDNPSFSGSGGSFGFAVPNGEYEILIEKNGFSSKTAGLSVANNVIAGDVEICVKKNNIYDIILISILLLLVVVRVIKPRLSVRKK